MKLNGTELPAQSTKRVRSTVVSVAILATALVGLQGCQTSTSLDGDTTVSQNPSTTQSHSPTPLPIPPVDITNINVNFAVLHISNQDVRAQGVSNGQGQFTLSFSAQIFQTAYGTMVYALVDNMTDWETVTDSANNLAILTYTTGGDGAEFNFPTAKVKEPCGPKNFRMDALGRDANSGKVFVFWSSSPVTVNLDCGTSTTIPPHYITGFWCGSANNTTTSHTGKINITINQDSVPQLSGGNTLYKISGRLTVFSPFKGNGPLQGWVDSNGNVTFHVKSDQVSGLSLDFMGDFLADPGGQWDISGTFTASTGQQGKWLVIAGSCFAGVEA